MDIIYASGRATAAEVMGNMADPPSYSTVRALLRVLEKKSHLRHIEEGPRYVYLPTVGRGTARRSALKHMMRTFFDGSAESVVAALLELESTKLSPADLDRIARLVDEAREEGR